MKATCQFCGIQFPYRKSKRFCSKRCYEGARRGADPVKLKAASPRSIDSDQVKENQRLVEHGQKRCSKCLAVHPLDGFRKMSKGIGGRDSRCKQCAASKDRARKQRIRADPVAHAKLLEYRSRKERAVAREVAALKRIARKARSSIGDEAQTKRALRAAKDRLNARLRDLWLILDAAGMRGEIAQHCLSMAGNDAWRNPLLSKACRWRARYRFDPDYAIRERLRRQIKKRRSGGSAHDCIRDALKRGGRSPKYEAILGYTTHELREHLERQFTNGMTWDRFMAGEIHIDHITPITAFDLSTEDGVRACWCLSNLRPMWAKENIAKSNKRLVLL